MPGQGRQKQDVEIVHAIPARRLCNARAYTRFVYVQTDDKRTHDEYFVTLYATHGGAEVPPLEKVEFLPDLVESFRRGGFKADEDAPAPRLRGERQKLFVVGEVDGGLGYPFLSQVRFRQSTEQVFGACDVFRPAADEIVVHDQHIFLADLLKFPDHIRDGPLPVMGPVKGRHAAKGAVQRAAARGLNGAERVSAGQQIMTGSRDILDFGEPSVIPGLQRAKPARPARPSAQTPSASPVTTESTRSVTSSRHMVA